MDSYFVISNSYGETTVRQYTKEELLQRITTEDGAHYWGNAEFMKEIKEPDTNYWQGNILIIKGAVVVPKPKQVITEYEI